MVCPKCGSENVNVQIVQQTKLVEKHHSFFWWICVGWLWVPIKWVLFFVPALIVKIFAPRKNKLKQRTRSICVCQNCGHHWKV